MLVLEILFLIYLCRKLGAILRSKGRAAGWWQLLLVVGWLGGEFCGAVIAGLVLGIDRGPAYLIALLCASAVAILLLSLAGSSPRVAPHRIAGFSVIQPARTRDPSEL